MAYGAGEFGWAKGGRYRQPVGYEGQERPLRERFIPEEARQAKAQRRSDSTFKPVAIPLTVKVRYLEKQLAKTTRLANKFAKSMKVAIHANARSLGTIKKIKAELVKERARTRKLLNDVKAGKRSTSSARRTIANQKRKIAGLKRQIDKHISKFRRSTSEIRDLRREIRSLERATARARVRREEPRTIPRDDYYYEDDMDFPLRGQEDDYYQQLPPGWEGTAMPQQMWESGQDWYPNDVVM